MHPRCKYVLWFVYAVRMSRHRPRRRNTTLKRPAPPLGEPGAAAQMVVRRAARVERLAYTRIQAAEALGISRSTFSRRVLPLLETIEMPWGTRLIPVDELKRLLAEQRTPARGRTPPALPGRPAALPAEIVDRIRAERAAGKSLRQIANDLNAAATPTAHGGAQWWPSTVRGVLASWTSRTSARQATSS